MKCKKCGKEIKKTDVFCQYCGTKVEAEKEVEKKVETKKTTTKTAEKVEAVKVEPTGEKKSGNGLAIAGMVLGIIGIVLSFVFGPFAFLFPLLGLILSLCAKKCGFKTAGIITSIVGFVIEIVITILAVTLFSSLMAIFGSYIDDYDDDYNYNYNYKYASVYGEWTCTPYPESNYSSKEETTLNFKYSGNFIYGPKGDLDNNHYSGTFTYEKEYEKNAKYTDREFIKVTPKVTEAMLDGVKKSTYDKSLNIEMEFINDYDEAIIIFENTYNTYHCKK